MIIEIGDARRVERLISLVEPLLDRKHWISNEALQTRRWCRILQTEESVCEWLPQIKNYIERKGNEHLISLAIGEWIGVPAQEAMRQGVCVAAEFSADEVGLSEVNFKYEPGDYAVFDEAMSFIIVCEKPDLAAIAGPESVLEEFFGHSLDQEFADFKSHAEEMKQHAWKLHEYYDVALIRCLE